MTGKCKIFRITLIATFLELAVFNELHTCFSQPLQSIDSVAVPASGKYKNPSFFLRMAVGKNYRKEWELSIKMPVFNINVEQGGLTITKPGGGHQTKSIRMISTDSTEWVLRSVDKNVRTVLPKILQHTPIQKFAQDMISSSHPYACLSVAIMSKATGIISSEPKLVYLPYDTSLGRYENDYAGKPYFFEQRHPLRPKTKAESMEDLLKELSKDNDNIIMQGQLLKARLLDMLNGDWDRHQDQWRWGKYDSLKRTWYYPIPVDRDQAFFRPKGILIRLINTIATPYLKGFKQNMNGLYQLNKTARNFDRVFLNELEQSEWIGIITEVQNRLNDSVLTDAVNALPAEIPGKSKDNIARVLRRRRDEMMKAVRKYYTRLAKNVYVFGSEKAELFQFTNTMDGLQLAVYNCKEAVDNCKLYERIFDKKCTKRIYLVGVTDSDTVTIDPGNKCCIKIMQVNDGHRKYDLRSKILKRLLDKKQ